MGGGGVALVWCLVLLCFRPELRIIPCSKLSRFKKTFSYAPFRID